MPHLLNDTNHLLLLAMLGDFSLEPLLDLGRISHEILQFIHVIGLDLEEPAFPVGVFVNDFGLSFQLLIYCNQFTAHRGENSSQPLPRFDLGETLSLDQFFTFWWKADIDDGAC